MSRTSRAAVRLLRSVLPAPRDEAAVRLLRAARDLVTGRTPPPPPPARRRRGRRRTAPPAYGLPVGPPLPFQPPVADTEAWVEPPVSHKVGLSGSMHAQDPRRRRFDVELLESLNEEYREKRIIPEPRELTSASLGAAAKERVLWAHKWVDLAEKKVLEVGCGNGYEVWSMAHNLGADAYGVDVQQPDCWEDLEGDRVHFRCVDLTQSNPFPDDSFERIVSYTVWEHVHHPSKLLEETYRILEPGGLMWLRANLWAGPQASHRYRDIYFPWPHHLFSDDVIAEWDARHGREPQGAAWVNKLTWNHYERYFHQAGFRLRRRAFQSLEWDEEFYQRFEDVLGRIPRWDLHRDFFTAVLEKPTSH